MTRRLEVSDPSVSMALISAAAILCAPLCLMAQPVPQTQVSSPEQAAALHYAPIKSIDFSSKHDVMIRNQDGSRTPMDMPYHTSKVIAPGQAVSPIPTGAS